VAGHLQRERLFPDHDLHHGDLQRGTNN
jgi:hypothetical protein